MKRGIQLGLVAALAFVCLAATAIEVKMERSKGSMKRRYIPNFTVLEERPQETLSAEPEYKGTPGYATLKLGNGDDNLVTIVVDETTGTKRIYVDANNDEDLTNDGEGKWDREAERSNFVSVEVQADYKGEGALPVYFNMYRFNVDPPDRRANNIYYYPNMSLKGTLSVNGKDYMIALVEPKVDGIFNDMMDEAVPKSVSGLMVDFNNDGKIDPDFALPEHVGDARMCSVTEPFLLEGKSWAITGISPSGSKVTVEESKIEAVPPDWSFAIGGEPPTFAHKDINGKMVDLEKLRGKVVLLDFWATWCGPCVAELPNVIPVWEKHKDDDFVIVSISLDQLGSLLSCNLERGDPQRQVNAKLQREYDSMSADKKAEVDAKAMAEFKKYIEKKGMTWTHIYEGMGWKTEIGAKYQVQSIPAMFLLDREGKLAGKGGELRGEGKLERIVSETLSKTGPAN